MQAEMILKFYLFINFLHVKGAMYPMIHFVVGQIVFYGSIMKSQLAWYSV